MNKILIISIAIGTLFMACSTKPNAEKTQAETTDENVFTLSAKAAAGLQLSTDTLVTKAINSNLLVSGQIDVPPQNLVSVSVPLGGYLVSIALLPGQPIKKGQIIATLQDQQYIQLQQEYVSLQAQLPALEQEFKRQKELQESNATSTKNAQAAEALYKSTYAQVQGLSQKLSMIGINTAKLTANTISKFVYLHSPINGYVTKVNANIGKYIAPTDILVELIDPTDIHLMLKVFEKDVNKLKKGQHVVAFTNNDTSKTYACDIILIGKTVESDRSTEVHCHFDKYDPALIPGTFMQASIQTQQAKYPCLPKEAVVQFEDNTWIFIAMGSNTYKMEAVVPVENTQSSQYVALENVTNLLGKPIVVKGAYTLLMAHKNKAEEE